MQFRPIISAMRRNKVGAILIAVQMAITLAILCNALFIIQQRIALSKRPTGVDEANVVVLDNQWVGNPPDQACASAGRPGGAAILAGRSGCVCHEYRSLDRQRLDRGHQPASGSEDRLGNGLPCTSATNMPSPRWD